MIDDVTAARGKPRIALLAALAVTLGVCAPSRADSLTPKITLRLASGMLTNVGTAKGSSTTIGNIQVGLLLFPTPTLGIGAGYYFNPDLTGGKIPLKGIMGGIRWYFLGEGTQVQRDFETMTSTTRAKWSMYTSFEVAQRDFFLKKLNPQTGMNENITGSSVAMNVGVGADLQLTSRLDLNLELSNTLFTFAATDPRYRIAATLFHIGIGLLF